MEGTIKPPAPLSNKGDMIENWTRWKKDFLIFIELSNYSDKPQDVQAYLLRNYIGEFGQRIIQKVVFENAADRDDMNKLLIKLEAHFNPVTEVMARYLFFTRCKQQNESIEDYVSDLKKKAEICNFGKLANSLIRDQIIFRLSDKALTKQLLEVKNLDLPKLVSVYKEHYNSITQKSQVSSESKKQNDIRTKCWRCNGRHAQKKCPAWNVKCAICGDLHHYSGCCRKTNLPNTETTVPRMYNPNENVYRSNTDLRARNIQHGNTMNTQALNPSAPPLPPSYGNQLYPYTYRN